MKPGFTPIQANDLWDSDRPTKTDLLDEALGDLRNAIEAVKETAARETAPSDKDVREILNAFMAQAYVRLCVNDGKIVFEMSMEGIDDTILDGDLKTIALDWFEGMPPEDIPPDLGAWKAFHEWLGSQLKKHRAD